MRDEVGDPLHDATLTTSYLNFLSRSRHVGRSWCRDNLDLVSICTPDTAINRDR